MTTPVPADDQEWADAVRVLANPDRLKEVFASALYRGGMVERAQTVCTLAARMLRCDYAAVDLITDEHAVAIATVGLAAGIVPVTQSVCRYAVASGKPFMVVDAAENRRLIEIELVANGVLRCYLGAPLVRGDQVIGALCVFSPQTREFTENEVELLVSFAAVLMEMEAEHVEEMGVSVGLPT